MDGSPRDLSPSDLPQERRADAAALAELMTEVTGSSPSPWSGAIIGFGTRHYRYESGREGDAPKVAFAPRKQHLVLYVTGYLEGYADLLPNLGPHRAGKGCLYVKRLSDIDLEVLRAIIARSFTAAD